MARISTYPRDTYVTGLDKWIGSDANTENFATKNFTANAVADYFNRSAIIDTGQFSWTFAPFSDTQPQADKSFQQIDHLAQNINILSLAAAPLRVSALTLANTTPQTFIVNEWVGQAILIHVPSGPSQYAIYNVVSVVPDTEWFFIMELELVSGVSATIQQGESLVFGYYNAANAVTEVKATFPILVEGTTEPTISLDVTTKNNWNTAYSRSLVSASVTGTTTKTLTLTEQGGGTITTSWVDDNTDAVTSVFGRTGAVVAQSGDYTTTLVTEGTNLYFTDQRARNVISSSITGIDYSNTTGIFSLTTGYFIPTTTQSATWNTAYNRSITSAAVTGTTTKTLTLNQQDGGTVTASWTDDNTNIITSVFGRTGAVVAESGDYTTTQVTEGTNLYFTNSRARSAISLTTTGTSGAATYDSATGILNVPQYQGGVTSFNTRTGAITLTSTDVTDALGFTPENVANKSNDTALGTSATLYPTQNAVKVYVDSATAGGVILQGDWNASTNVPDITGTTQTGFAWRVSVAGNTNLGGITDWLVGDLAVKSATGWIKIDNTESVTSVFGRFGTVVAQTGDYTSDQVTEGTTNLYFTTARARASISAGTGISYDSATGVISSAGGSVTSVGLSMPTAFTVTNSPVTGAGTLTVTGAGTTAQYIRGDGTLATLPGTSAEARSIVREVYNKTGATLTKGTVVYINSGQGNLPAVTKAIATGDMTSAQTFGVVQGDISDQSNGFVVVTGGLENLDTQGLGVGTQLYLSSTVAGAYTTVKQYAPAHLVYVAVVVRDHPTQGVLEVNIQNGYELDELHNVSAQSPANNDIIAYNTATSLWEKKSIATTLGYTPANAATTISINGTAQDLSQNRTWSVGTVTSVGLSLGTSGTDANISNSPITSTGEITLNLPTASATNRGLLSNGDWTTFNNKQTLLSGNGFVNMSGSTVSYITGSSSQFVKADGSLDSNTYLTTSSAASTYVPYTGATTNVTLGAYSLTATSLIKSGGTSAQILAADGSVITAGTNITISGGTISASGGGASSSARTEQTFTATAGTNNLTITGGYTVGLVDVYVNGVKYAPSDFTATTSPTVTITGLVAGDIIDVINYTSSITLLPTSRDVFDYTATANQVNFTVTGGYTVGLLDVYVNGTKLTSSEFTATDGAIFTLTFASVAGNQVQAIRYNSSVTGISGSGTTNYVPKFTATGTIGNSLLYSGTSGVGIGTTTPKESFEVAGLNGNLRLYGKSGITNNLISSNVYYDGSTWTRDNTSYGAAQIVLSSTAGAIIFGTTSATSGEPTERMRINPVGNLMLGGTTSDSNAYRFYLKSATSDSSSYVITAYNSSSNGMFYVRSTGDIFFPAYANGTLSASSGQIVSSSDINLKIDDGGIENGLEKVMNLNPRYFYWKEESGISETDRQLGFYAQEIQEALGNEVANCNSENKWGIYDRGIIAMLTKAIQELSTKLDEANTRLQLLENK